MQDFHIKTQICLGTVITLNIPGKQVISDQIFNMIKKYENMFSVYLNKSDVHNINENAGVNYVDVAEPTLMLIKSAIHYSELTNQAFDITVEPVMQAWGFSAKKFCIPSIKEIEKLLPLVNFRMIQIENNKAGLGNIGQKLSLGAIAKGFIADKIIEFLKSSHIEHALINLGGNIYAFGKNPANYPWQIGIQNPGGRKSKPAGIIYVTDVSVVTSGIYERYFYKYFKRYHHLIDPRTGRQPEHNLVSVTVIGRPSLEADALATSFFIMGYNDSIPIIKKRKHLDVIFIDKNNNILLTKGLKNKFQLLEKKYKIFYF